MCRRFGDWVGSFIVGSPFHVFGLPQCCWKWKRILVQQSSSNHTGSGWKLVVGFYNEWASLLASWELPIPNNAYARIQSKGSMNHNNS